MDDLNINAPEEFDWDHGNVPKLIRRHEVDPQECEEAFRNRPLIMADEKHSQVEKRYVAYGHTNDDRKLVMIFTVRNRRIRVLSARPMDRKERQWYGQQET
jgi:uncharacterized DUF497 family protein